MRHAAALACLHTSRVRTQARLQLDEAELRHCVRRLPALLGYSYEDNLSPKLDRLQACLGVGVGLTLTLTWGSRRAARWWPRSSTADVWCARAHPVVG